MDRSYVTSSRLGVPLSLIMSDIDDFKQYNDRHGHAAGDKLLVDVAGFIMKEKRDMDLAVRYGGEEFLMLLPETESQGALNLAERIRSAVEQGTDVTISVGIATLQPGMKKEDLVQRADDALYKAKLAGKNQVAGFDQNT